MEQEAEKLEEPEMVKVKEISIFQNQQGSCIYKLTVVVAGHTSSPEAQERTNSSMEKGGGRIDPLLARGLLVIDSC